MGKGSLVPWCDHSFNPWWGCAKVDHGCDSCYAERWARRFGWPGLWGAASSRRLFGDRHWREPLHWDRQAEKAGRPALVFCGSMCDVFELHPAAHWRIVLDRERGKLWKLIYDTPHLIWLLLTKRPANIPRVVPWQNWPLRAWPNNVWPGVSICHPPLDRTRLPPLVQINAQVRFLSLEPLLSPIDLRFGPHQSCIWCKGTGEWLTDSGDPVACECMTNNRLINWVILGGESHPSPWKARPLPLDAARSIIADCQANGIPVFVKQLGTNWAYNTFLHDDRTPWELGDRKGERMDLWPEDLRLRQFPAQAERGENYAESA